MSEKTIYIDFDGTICPNKGDFGEFPPPRKSCINLIKSLKKASYKIVIYSVRSNFNESSREYGHHEMVDYLNKHGIVYDEIDYSKKHFNMVIDDKCCGIPLDGDGNVDWTVIESILISKKYI
jgi:histidinol phosphatase-like enzyme